MRLRGTYLALFGAAYGVSPVVAEALFEARLPDAIWKIQLVAAALAAAGLFALKTIRKQKAEG